MFDRFRAATQAQQIALIAVGTIAVILGLVWFLLLRTSYQPLFTELRSNDAAAIVADLDRKKIPYRLENGGTTILVPSDMVDATRLSVMSEDLPLKGTVGFELFNKSDMGLTDFAQKINYQRALQGELARTIMTLDGVDTARVHLSLGEDRIFRDDRVPPTASVTIRMEHGATLSQSAAQGVQRLVAAAVPNLDVANVVILDEAGRVVGPAPAAEAVSASLSPVSQEKFAIQGYYEALVRQALERAYPLNSIAVAVSADVPDSAEGGAQDASGLPAWNPGARQFALAITLSPAIALDLASQENARRLATAAVGPSPVPGDAIVFAAPAYAAQAPLAVHARRGDGEGMAGAPAFAASDDGAGWSIETVFALLMLLVVFAGFGLLLRRLRGTRRLSERQRADFASKLRTILEREGGHVAS
jgi:flagellar M-ring protein FliF